ncbi:MAG: hypothetical protein LUQ32_05420 [Methanomicrobiales archaeon]|nr:hypothetical protein [Methanomicrobiales archaeon]
MDMDRILVWATGILVVLCIAVAGAVLLPALGAPMAVTGPEAGCLASGGTVSSAACCLSSGDFPSSCLIGACGCSPENSHAVKTCTCPAGTCFNGTACVPQIRSFGECVAAGYPVMESYPRQCRVPGGPTFVEELPPPLTEESCRAARGHWNECGSRCQLDNTGKEGVACPAMCEALCECGGIAGFGCPGGYSCKLVPDIADALGYCVAGG